MRYFIFMFALMLIGCSNKSESSPGKLGHWIDTYPSEYSIWQCVEPVTPYRNEEC